ncbi:MAG: hypothetical protein HYY65_07175 [Candidatus Tectomicrobia bacterium]|uniref:Uncharacterized protein n=1 Tax=Tectimicrobiota bacterium TaxID=2528274 RepID=A0A932GPY1_UNCTE|nr:hypothetical protein [Candidatus Tectomicrobia bacterium]
MKKVSQTRQKETHFDLNGPARTANFLRNEIVQVTGFAPLRRHFLAGYHYKHAFWTLPTARSHGRTPFRR